MQIWKRIGVLLPFAVCLVGLCAGAPQADTAPQFPPSMLDGLQWRDVGPMRGGRSFAVAGNAHQPDTFYFGAAGGGVWKTENAGRTWEPISDEGVPIGSIGAIAVAPSDPNVVYVGTGEPDIRSQHSYGIGVYKSTDAGKTWSYVGLRDTEHIGRIVVDPNHPNLVYVAALGHAYDANPDRGVFRSTDGGLNWKKVLYTNDNTGAIDLAIDARNPRVLYASLWATRRPPWSVYAPSNMPGGGLYKTIDGGDHWQKLGGGLPNDDAVGKIGIAIAPSNSNRLWAVVDDLGTAIAAPINGGGGRGGRGAESGAAPPPGGVYVSDDAGATWRRVNDENRLWGRGWYFEAVEVDPTNPDRAYVINTSTYMTTDGGKTFTPIKGAPGGDDYHQIWINPSDGNRMVLSSDQGTVVSVDGGKTWSTWYNQPTAEMYHSAANFQFPYWLYGAQQDSGAVGVATWSNEGLLNFRSWLPLCVGGESGYVAPDPTAEGTLFGGAGQRCNQTLNIGTSLGAIPPSDPNDPNRKTWTLPLVFSQADHALYYANQFVFRTRDSGRTWDRISPDLTRENPPVPANLDPVTAKDIDEAMTDHFGVVYTIAPSPLQADTVWVGTDDGLIKLTRDGGANWQDVTPPAMTPWSKVSMIDAGHFDPDTAYAAVDRHRLADMKPYIYRTHDGGKTWQDVTNGIPDGAYVNSVKEDPVRKGLLFAATELRAYVSFDDGDHWQSLQRDMPVTSVRDFAFFGSDGLAVATHGRGNWVIDDITPLREINADVAASNVYLFKPGDALDLRQGGMNGTPLPPEDPQLPNPPNGALVYYWLKTAPAQPIKLELVDGNGTVRACYASDAPVPTINVETLEVPAHWETPPERLLATPGMHRFTVALGGGGRGGFGGGRGRGGAPAAQDACTRAMPTAAVPAGRGRGRGGFGGRGGRGAGGIQPGDYTVRLTVDGQGLNQPLTIKPDPRPGAEQAEEAGGRGGN